MNSKLDTWMNIESNELHGINIHDIANKLKAINCKKKHKVLFCNPYGDSNCLHDLQVVSWLKPIDM
jgi:hypothetical protein